MTLQKWFYALAITGFISAVSFFQINSAWADAHQMNWLWKVLGWGFAIAFLYCGYRAAKLAKWF